MKKVLFISSTGGHLSELMKLKELFKEFNYHIITEKDITTEYLKQEYGNKVNYLPYSTRSKPIKYLFIYSFLIIKTIFLFLKIRPDIIVSTGTHTAVPMCYLARAFNKKVIYIETFANINKKTLSGRLIYPISNLFIVQWKEMKQLYPKAIYIDENIQKMY